MKYNSCLYEVQCQDALNAIFGDIINYVNIILLDNEVFFWRSAVEFMSICPFKPEDCSVFLYNYGGDLIVTVIYLLVNTDKFKRDKVIWKIRGRVSLLYETIRRSFG